MKKVVILGCIMCSLVFSSQVNAQNVSITVQVPLSTQERAALDQRALDQNKTVENILEDIVSSLIGSYVSQIKEDQKIKREDKFLKKFRRADESKKSNIETILRNVP
jgi:hypothetical protein